jgi:hypothetical protein
MVKEDQKNFDEFMEQNVEIFLPGDLNVDNEIPPEPIEGEMVVVNESPLPSVKDVDTPPLWTEVVRKGKNRSRPTRIEPNDRRILEYLRSG